MCSSKVELKTHTFLQNMSLLNKLRVKMNVYMVGVALNAITADIVFYCKCTSTTKV